MRYVHRFSRTVSCEIEVTEDPPAKGASHVLSVEWTGNRKKSHIPEYMRWMHLVNQKCAEKWKLKLMHVFQKSPNPGDWEAWGYEPGKPPVKVELPLKPENAANGQQPAWAKDLAFVFRGVQGCTVTTPIGEQCPIIWVMDFKDIETIFSRLGLREMIDEHAEELRKMPQQGAEMRVMRDFTYGFTHMLSKRKYELQSFIWYFKNDETPLDAAGVIGVAPAGAEGLVAAKVRELRENSEAFQSLGATLCEFTRKNTELEN
jgi:hypothetical protein